MFRCCASKKNVSLDWNTWALLNNGMAAGTERSQAAQSGCMLHFIHIGKTGGSAIQAALRQSGDANVAIHPHAFRLEDVPEPDSCFFSVRHPVERFISGFNSRLRKGQPRTYVEWTEGERRAYERFPTANALAEALGDPHARAAAEDAMAGIEHARRLTYWIPSVEALEAHAEHIAMICHQPTLEQDFRLLKRRLGWPATVRLPEDPIAAHITPAGYVRNVSPRARSNLLAWFEEDLLVYGAALMLRAHLINSRG